MAAAIGLRGDYDAAKLRELAKQSEDADQTRRLMALAVVYDGGSRSDGAKTGGDYNTNGIGASVEAGKHIKLQDDWFVEPYAQLSSLWVQGADYSLDNGMRADSNKADSFLGKVGTTVGRNFPLDKGGYVQPYVKVALAHEFANSNRVKVNDNTFSNDLSGSRGELGAGIAAQLTDVLQLHADVDYSNGKNIEQPWGVNVGVRYSW